MPAISPRKLPELYYLQNFCRVLHSLSERYSGLLSEAEQGFIRQFTALPVPSQCLLTRLLMRKGALFRRKTIHYAEIGNLEAALTPLIDLGWAETDPALSFDELWQLLSRAEWRAAFGSFTRRSLPEPGTAQLALPLFSEPLARPLSQWHRELGTTHIRITVEPTAKRLQLLYFGNDHQSLAEFVLSDLGLQRYESIPFNSDSRPFRSREEIEHFYRLHECRARLRERQPPAAILEQSWRPEGVANWLQAQFCKLQLRLGELIERQGDHELALRAYRGCDSIGARIRIARVQEQMGCLATARDEAASALQSAWREGDRETIVRMLSRLGRRMREKGTPEVPRLKAEVVELSIPQPPAGERIERRISSMLSSNNCPAFYVENSLFPSLFGLLCWNAIFAPLPGAFFHPFQSGPADLFTAEFRARRAPLFEAQLALLDSGRYKEVILRHYREKAGISTLFVRWGRLRPTILKLALECIPPAHLKLVFERLLEDLEHHCSGLPDLIHFTPDEQRYRLIEVKAPGDRLQDNQRRWLDFFGKHAIPAAVYKVRWN